jgi:hypothetical protein
LNNCCNVADVCKDTTEANLPGECTVRTRILIIPMFVARHMNSHMCTC